ncbi:MAG: glycosyltransferase [Bacteroidales bacterium]|nr:glycosyltransferase [Bacteroidales bacterium]MCM1416248.1 glycosyltransferase [bacterium]MCM1423134.1 glycosyltransferase [bacterium]
MKVSLLVTVYNVKNTLPITLGSIEEQDYPNLEVVIVDGGSTDGTVELIRAFAARTEERQGFSVRWVSEPDNGLYDAMNKAFHMSTGEVVAVCNDKLCKPEAVSLFAAAIERGGSRCVGAHADLVYVEGERVVREWRMGQGTLSEGWMPGHPTLFLRRRIYETYGLYDTSYRCAADYEFMVRFLKDENNELAYVPKILIAMFYGGTSNAGLSNYLLSFREGFRALKKNKVPHPLLITLRRSLRVLKQFR